MPRKPRRNIPGVTYHVIPRFVDREWFIASELERWTYLDLFGRAVERSTWTCLGYAVMSNHIHLSLVASDEPLANWLRTPHARFADWMNRTHKRIGGIFTRGPKDILIPDARVGHVLAYIHNNPVRAKLVSEPSQSAWTSHRYYTGVEPPPSWLKVKEGFARMGADVRRRDEFDGFVRRTTGHPVLGDVETDEEFMRKLEAYEHEQIALLERPPVTRVPPHVIVAIGAAEAGISIAQLQSARRGHAETRARAAIVRYGVQLGLTTSELVEALQLTRQAISKILRGVVHADVDELMQRIERRSTEALGEAALRRLG